jgi:flagellar biosynthesis protein FlhB
MSSGGEERTEQPTPKKVKENRKEGKVPRTQELGSWGALLPSPWSCTGWWGWAPAGCGS